MKQYLTLKSVCGVAVLVLMTSCVAKRKYVDAQNQISQLQTENAQLKEQGTTMQTNLTSLEANNRSLQTRLDSTNTWVSGQQTRWNSFQAFYDEGTRTAEQVHQQLHQQMDDLIGAENITTSGGRVYVTLTEKTLFASGSSKLTAKGEQVLAQLASTIKENPNVEIDIASVPGYYTAGSMTNGNTTMSSDMNNNATTSNTTTNNQNATNTDTKVKMDDDLKMKDGDTKVKVDADGDVKVKTDASKTKSSTARTSNGYTKKSATSSYSGAAKTKTSTARKSSETRSKTYSSSPAKKSSAGSTWSLNMARSSSIAKKLVDEGVAKSRILVNNTTSTESNTKKDFQVIISPKSDTYYETIGNGSGMNK